jgi:RHS repeat-associated protein
MLGSGFSPCQALFCASRRFTPYRLTAADYSNNDYYHYTYDAVGNRLTQANMVNGLSSTVSYVYDDANRLTSVNGVTYTWDNNGNLLNDGVNTYTYNAANQLKTMTSPSVNASYAYNGMGDRLQQVHNGGTTNFMMDYNAGLTQVLNDGTNNYIYGNGRIAQVNTGTEYFLGDALGSVRQLTNSSGAITYASAYDPYGVTTQTHGAAQTTYGFTGEYTSNDLVYLRARMYAPGMGRFLTRDTWDGNVNQPMSFNRWNYVYANPTNLTDPSGLCPTCFVYLFPGAGNEGDVDHNFSLDDNLGDSERKLVEALRRRGITVLPIYPYGAGIRTNWTEQNPVTISGEDLDTNGNFRYALLPSAYNHSTIPRTKADEILDYFNICRQEDKWNITFIGYSGGGQMAYSIAQKLAGRMFVDNLVLLGAAFRARNGLGNIGHIWDLVGEHDTDRFGKGGEKILGWDRYNRGYRKAYMGGYLDVYTPSLDIYRNGATQCTLYGPHYVHYGYGDYFEARTSVIDGNGVTLNLPFNGVRCSTGGAGTTRGLYVPGNDRSRLENLVNFLINIVGVGRQK